MKRGKTTNEYLAEFIVEKVVDHVEIKDSMKLQKTLSLLDRCKDRLDRCKDRLEKELQKKGEVKECGSCTLPFFIPQSHGEKCVINEMEECDDWCLDCLFICDDCEFGMCGNHINKCQTCKSDLCNLCANSHNC
jgi:hypothetical protein